MATRIGQLRPALLRVEVKTVLFMIVIMWVGVIVLYPILLLFVDSFKIGDGVFTPRAGWGISNWVSAYQNPGLIQALWNTILIVAIVQTVATPIGITLAWLTARTDLPGKEWIDLAFWVAFFLPTLPVVLGYILLLAPEFGLLNQAWAAVFGGSGPFNIYSMAGIVWLHLVTKTIAVKAILLRPVFQNMDASLEEAARICGTSGPLTLFRIVMPIMTPAIMTVVLLGILFGLESFEIERVVGPPIQFFNYGTFIFREVAKQPPSFANATALGVSVLVLMTPLILLQQWNARRRRYTTITGQFKPQLFPLGRFRWPAFAGAMFFISLITVVPLSMMMLGTFMKLFGFFDVTGSPFTMENWTDVLGDPIFLSSVKNTLIIAFGAAGVAMTVYSTVAYIVVRTRFIGRHVLDFVSWMPITIPGIVLGLGLMLVLLNIPLLRPLFGTHWALIAAVSVTSMTIGVQLLKSNLLQISAELEEASWLAGAGWFYTFRRIVLPLMAPTLIAVGTLAFVGATRAVSHIAILTTSSTRPLAILQLDHIVDGRFEEASVVGALIVFMTLGIAVVARYFGLNMGVQRG
ncbi:MAG: iron ABC transporter permease [Chloroflexi bacterium]|nr:iron ABC transporter permease [Chloroflexota bacterium]MYB85339.1 iron ABC transporter permease [Chloroflexota bacterium]MYK34134.1 iron ABC transporter permease [Chloroflexota bacterium]